MEPVTAVVIGAGSRGRDAYASYALRHPNELQIVGVAEPDEARRNQLVQEQQIPESGAFESWEGLLEKKKFADAAFICTQDQMHLEPAVEAMKKGYHLLLEKPIAPTLEECLEIHGASRKYGVSVAVAHVLRYSPFFMALKRIIDQGAIGAVRGIQHNENIGHIHYSHSFVRGNWRSRADSSPMILAKSCHDLDILSYLVDGEGISLASMGTRGTFSGQNAPAGAPRRCLEGCPQQVPCPYYAPKVYRQGETGWPVNVITTDLSPEGILRALREGPYGRCVYACDNDMVEHQVVSLEFSRGITAAFTMSAFTHDTSRTLKVMGETGEIRGHMEREVLEVHDFRTGEVQTISLGGCHNGTRHGGGDEGIVRDLVLHLRSDRKTPLKTTLDLAMESHVMAFAAEESMQTGKTIDLGVYKKEHGVL
ncbi:Oxidoreductase family, C-terminal alpha/beta domain [Alkalispirochaeta americana]|uniref:Oxidoreductase family, C-terminal alpha/beta domain n=1 Tax=Alkalispirochaeta americana TaxID=159291 RepID=A0A1N6N6D6_9SPIO|nr:Gfo/Idh/MocA family oxidoreductase [Alkalispirochaeta americana]SIP87589.1 Oxidoreductase family, C-terminal alpha/beta domain [Alkalispirochaeta americana]